MDVTVHKNMCVHVWLPAFDVHHLVQCCWSQLSRSVVKVSYWIVPVSSDIIRAGQAWKQIDRTLS